MRRSALHESIQAFAARIPFTLKLAAYSYAFILLLEGLGWLVFSDMLSTTRWTALDRGGWTIFVAALIVTDSFAIYLRTPLFYLANAAKLLYPLYNAARLIIVLSSPSPNDFFRFWSAIRLLFTIFWLSSSILAFSMVAEQDGSDLEEIGIQYSYSSGSDPGRYED